MSSTSSNNNIPTKLALTGYSLYRKYLKAASLAPQVVRSKLLFNIRDAFVITRDTELSQYARMELLERGAIDLNTLQKFVLLPHEYQILQLREKRGLYHPPPKQL
jgi:hypothetical protein